MSEMNQGTTVGFDELDVQRLRELAASFKVLADETRLRVLSLLMQSGELNVRSLCEYLDQSQPAVSHHLALLREAGLIRARRDGKHNFYRCLTENLERLIDASWRDAIAIRTDRDTSELVNTIHVAAPTAKPNVSTASMSSQSVSTSPVSKPAVSSTAATRDSSATDRMPDAALSESSPSPRPAQIAASRMPARALRS